VSTPRYQWQPTTAEIAARIGVPVQDVIRFDHNTSPFPSDWAPAVVTEAARHLNEYPGADYRPIREAAAKYIGVDPDAVVPGAGIDELIFLATRALAPSGGIVAAASPTYPLYRIAAVQQHCRFLEVPLLSPDFAFPRDALLGAARDADLVWLCIPNNPTGNRIDEDLLTDTLAAAGGVVVIDAAYAEFASDDWGPWVERHQNLLVMHTLSKGFGLAGARVGYAVGVPELIDAIDGVRPPGSISSLSVDLATAALDEPNRMRRRVDRLNKQRSRLGSELDQLHMTVLPSSANFVLCLVGDSAHGLATALLEDGLVVRTFPEGSALADYLRFTVRAPEENDRLLAALWGALP